ncbi:MAG: hypothetical protein A2W93_12315 [Bacteroidetes bacterium GWF2_43_63]|nr:MAG: hypothetical protein A2W94_07000 [Bacteroidetes bacterium GWE2_42_42]OFY56451.1 MAG: hypothetical protein A2W93_12315 [Bacteroidetes bacterium GWF2_43_63]HBG71205.1 hypothetical protein [Bacteroidales bacterium]HCB61288.1 hypothetical protein [Bacteroidales bacterium]HCY23305.1 hypothetical protein [Bacteroidales bacterium]
MSRILIFLLIATLFSAASLKAQDTETNNLVQFSGVVVSADSLKPLPFTHIIIKNSHRGTMADFFGFFSFVAEKGDIIEFTSVGYKKSFYKIPDSLSGSRYSLIQMMQTDTLLLTETVIYPWPTPDQFKQAFLQTRPPEDDYDRALKNLTLAELKERAAEMPSSGSMNFKNQIDLTTSRLYYAGQLPPNNLLNPLAWSQFIKAWKNGDFKRKDSRDNDYFYNEPLK